MLHSNNEDNYVIRTCSGGDTCSVSIIKINIESHNHKAEVVCAVYGYSEVIASSSTITVRWVECLSDADCGGGFRCDTSRNECYRSCSSDTVCKTELGYYCLCGTCLTPGSNPFTDGCCTRSISISIPAPGHKYNIAQIFNYGDKSYICAPVTQTPPSIPNPPNIPI